MAKKRIAGRPIAQELTKQMLIDWGITDIHYLDEYPRLKEKVALTDGDAFSEWWVERCWKGPGPGTSCKYKRIKVTGSLSRHKYGGDKFYPKVTFSIGTGKNVTITLARLIYCWFVGDIPAGMVIDHKDNNPFNNKVDNLQMLTYEENLKKRFEDNPDNAHNQ